MEICCAFQNRLFLFSCACLSGILFALVWRKYEQTVQFSAIRNHYSFSLRKPNYNDWLKSRNLTILPVAEEIVRYSKKARALNSESSYLYRTTPVLCLVFVNSHKGAQAVKNTWGQHCNIVSFFGRFSDAKIPVVKIPSSVTSFEGFCSALTHIYRKYGGFDWVLIADDLTYAIVENLRYYLAGLNSSHPYYLGHPVKDFSTLYNVGNAGIVLSKGSLSILHSIYGSPRDCVLKRSPSWYFDQSVGKLLNAFKVQPVDTRDEHLRSRFNPFSAETMLIPGSISVFSSYWRTSAFLSEEGMNCCSDAAITFHGLLPSKMYLMEFLQYHMTVFRDSKEGLGNHPPPDTLPKSKHDYSKERVGEPFVQLVDQEWVRSKKKHRVTHAKTFWNEMFGS